jgi:hypothetical protein
VVRQVHADLAALSKSALGRFSFAILKNPAVFCNRHGLSFFGALFLSGCSSGGLMSDVTWAIYQERFGSGVDVSLTAPLNPAIRYLRVEATGTRPALLALGYIDPHPQGDIEVWYSGSKEVIKIQNGRIVGTAGLRFDWRNVQFGSAPPAWEVVSQSPQRLVRVRDEMPGYRYGISEQLTVEAVAGTPVIELPSTLPVALASHYTWYRESASSLGAGALPASWYAVGRFYGKQAVVYSFQCLEPHWCLRIQSWPPEKDLS